MEQSSRFAARREIRRFAERNNHVSSHLLNLAYSGMPIFIGHRLVPPIIPFGYSDRALANPAPPFAMNRRIANRIRRAERSTWQIDIIRFHTNCVLRTRPDNQHAIQIKDRTTATSRAA